MSDDAKALNAMITALALSAEGDLRGGNQLFDAILEMDVAPCEKVRARRSKSLNLFQLGEWEQAAHEAEIALALDQKEHSGEFDEEEDRGILFVNLDCAWYERLKEFGRKGQLQAGIQYGEEKLHFVGHIPGTYMPLTQLWVGRKLAWQGEVERALAHLRAGLSAEAIDIGNYAELVEDAASAARTTLDMYGAYGALSPQQAFEFGTAAMEAGDDKMAIRAYEDVLSLDVAPGVSAHAHVRLSLLHQKQRNMKKAVEHGEKALQADAELTPGILSDRSDDSRDILFAKLEGSWVQAAAGVEASDGVSAAREYLLQRLNLVSHLADDYFPLLRLQIGKYSVEMGDADTARDNLINAVASEFPRSDNVTLLQLYQGVREEASKWVLRSARMRNTGRVSGPAKSKPDKAAAGKCWIATAACGPDSVEVLLLRRFRDRNCDQGWKAAAIREYYRTAPAVAQVIARHDVLRRLVRLLVVRPASWIVLWYFATSKRSN
jgi:tetratricopeptide (TPR) repeat protein